MTVVLITIVSIISFVLGIGASNYFNRKQTVVQEPVESPSLPEQPNVVEVSNYNPITLQAQVILPTDLEKEYVKQEIVKMLMDEIFNSGAITVEERKMQQNKVSPPSNIPHTRYNATLTTLIK